MLVVVRSASVAGHVVSVIDRTESNSKEDRMSIKRKRNKKYAAVRMLERVAREISRLNDSISTVTAGREVADLQQSLRNLKRLSEDDPNNFFWDRLQKTVIRILRYLAAKRH